MSKVALITGASSGIGSATAISLARRGVHSIVTYYCHEERARHTVEEVARNGAKAIPLRLDVSRSETFPAFRDEVAAALERHWSTSSLDFLVNNAGAGGMAFLQDMTEELFDGFMRVLFKGPYFLTRAMLPILADGGAIVNTGSTSALPSCTEEGYSAYASMKGGLHVFTRSMAKELSRRGIRVNAVAPGPTRTSIGDDVFEKCPELIPPLVERTALGRLGEPADIGDVIAALCSEDFRWVTGQNIEVSGGYRM